MREPTDELLLHPYRAMRRPQPRDYFPTVAGDWRSPWWLA